MYVNWALPSSNGDLSFAAFIKKVRPTKNDTPAQHKIKNRDKLEEGISKSYAILKGFKPQ